MKAKQSVEEQFKDRLVRLLKENVRYLVDDRDDPRVGILARDQMEGFLMLWLRDAIAQAKQEERDTLKAQVRQEIEGLKNKHSSGQGWTNHLEIGYKDGITDCLSIPSLKGEE